MIDFEATILCHPIRLRTSKRGEAAGMRNMGCSWACPAGKSWVCGTEQRRQRKAAYTKLARQVEIGKRQDREDILYRLRVIEACINKTDKRTLRIWKQLQQLLHLESEETE